MKKLPLLLALVLSLFLLQCRQEVVNEKESLHLGTIHVQVNAKAEAIPAFEEGLLLLHSFEYDDAAEKFALAQEIDPEFVMAYWGQAMSKNHPLWNKQATEEAREILNKLAPTPQERQAKIKSDWEKDLFNGAEILFGEGDKLERDDRYMEYMASLYQKYPGNHEIAAWYALSLLGSVEEGRDYEVYGKGAQIAKGILAENPEHPGALHYLIHAYDDPEHAQLALATANSYSKVAPDAGHALHMPSHIYVALGMWDEVINSNIASWNASEAQMKRKNLKSNDNGYHAFKWLMYGYLQKGNFDKAKELVYEMKHYCQAHASPRARGHLIMMKGAYLSESDRWGDPIALEPVEHEDLSINIRAAQKFIEGMVQFKVQDQLGLQTTIFQLEKILDETKDIAFTKGAKMCSGGSYQGLPSQVDIDQAQVVKMELQALLALLQNKDSEVQDWLEKATALEKSTSFDFGPPMIIKPSGELYAEWLISRNKKEAAKVQLQEVLLRAPKRRIPDLYLANM